MVDIMLSIVNDLSSADLTEPKGHHHIGLTLRSRRPGDELLYERFDILRLIRR